MSNKLSDEALAEILRTNREGGNDAMTCVCYEYQCPCHRAMPSVLDHCTALEEELKAAQDEIAAHRCLPKKVRDDAVNDFRTKLVEAFNERCMWWAWDETAIPKIVQLISTFEAGE